ncbi:hypothetical protein MVES_000519 [Malassezia vespertilionis]|uniref:Anaphase-promoting complex subunit 5 n=1 Tax=Malassezia vespertilionis TaxID=2020962 RepID=A0A2N1JH29_9BASI|nr:hypothetical protein MVES_000519 [Malassezia vespertilionis]
MISTGSQQTLDGYQVSLLLIVTFLCQLDLPPSHLADLERQLGYLLSQYPETCVELKAYLQRAFAALHGMDGLIELFHAKLLDCIYLQHEDASQPACQLLDRRSFLGVYVRRSRLTFDMLLDEERRQLADICKAWRSGRSDTSVDEWDKTPQARTYKLWRTGVHSGDYAMAKDQLHAFFDLTIPGCDQELHQHALLNLAKFHIDTGGIPAARTTLDEAILLARTVGDTECMRACDALLEKLAYYASGAPDPHAWLLTRRDAQEALAAGAYSPLLLWKAAQGGQRGQPLLALVQTIADATWASRHAKNDVHLPGLDWEPRPSVERNAACSSALLARLWLTLGVSSVTEAYEAHVANLAYAKPYDWDDLRLSTAATCAYRGGAYDEAVQALVDKSTVSLLHSMRQRKAWHTSVMDIVYLRARRQAHTATLRALQTLYPHLDAALAQEPPSHAHTEQLLDEARSILRAEQPQQCLEVLMKAIAASEQQHLFPLHRAGLAVLAEVMLTGLDMPREAIKIVEEILPHALADTNVERRAHAESVYAKCLLSKKDVRGARGWLVRAEKDFAKTENVREQATCLYLLSRLAKHGGDDAQSSHAFAMYEQARRQEHVAATDAAPSAFYAAQHAFCLAVCSSTSAERTG